MKTLKRIVLSATIPLTAVFLLAETGRSQNAALVTLLSNPPNNQVLGAPANIYVHARMADTNLVQTVQYFSGTTNIGLVTNTSAAFRLAPVWGFRWGPATSDSRTATIHSARRRRRSHQWD